MINQAAPLLGMNLGGEVSGEIVPFEVGLFVRGFTYDGVGRLIRTVSPWPSPDLSGGEVRVERYFYDGVRRISEVVTDPMESLALAMSSGGEGQTEAQQAYAAEPELEGESLPVSVQQGQEGGGGSGSQNSSSGNPQTPVGGVTLSREYIWGPGDAGLDELLVQFGASREAAWPVHDAGGDLIALCDTGGAGGSARLAGEWTHDAYGNAVTAASHHAFAEPRLGHKGLFIERLDGGVIDPATGYEVPRLEPGATTLAFARNRHLHTAFGRWLQEDPNATGQSLLQQQAFHGAAVTGVALKVDVESLYGDGMALAVYVGSAPLMREDAMGLDWSPVGLMFSSTTVADLEADWAQDVLDAGESVGSSVENYFADLSAAYAADLDWASDWSQADTGYSKQSREARIAALRGMADGGILGELLGEDVLASGPAMAGFGEKHHPIPKFLGGAVKTTLQKLPRTAHRLFHAKLNAKLKHITQKYHPKGKGYIDNYGTKNWEKLIHDHPELRLKIVYALQESADEVGYGMRGVLDAALKAKGWIP